MRDRNLTRLRTILLDGPKGKANELGNGLAACGVSGGIRIGWGLMLLGDPSLPEVTTHILPILSKWQVQAWLCWDSA